jgi:hypothetical protein
MNSNKEGELPGLDRARSLQKPSEPGLRNTHRREEEPTRSRGGSHTRTGPDARRPGLRRERAAEAEGSSERGSARPAARRRGREGLGLKFESRVGGGCGGGARGRRPASPWTHRGHNFLDNLTYFNRFLFELPHGRLLFYFIHFLITTR